MKKYLELIRQSILAGVLIGIAACIYMSCENKIIGSVLFSIGLIGVVLFQAYLFTGKIGYVNSFKKLSASIIGLACNLLAAFLVGVIYKLCVGESAAFLSRLDKSYIRLLFDGFICGSLIYIGVETFKIHNNIILLTLAVMAFILCGAEHCIADICYFGAGDFSIEALLRILVIIVGNSIGSLLVRYLEVGYENFKHR